MNSGPQQFNHRRIFKYPVEVVSRQIIQMPTGAQVLSVGRQGPMPFLWASVDDTQPLEPRVFRLVTTGEVFNEERLLYVGHIQLGGEKPTEGWFEAHFYEVETALAQINPDPISDRFQEDIDEINREQRELGSYSSPYTALLPRKQETYGSPPDEPKVVMT
jgi:hypothetical protein